MRRWLILFFVAVAACLSATAQTPAQAITGITISQFGQPIPFAQIRVCAAASSTGTPCTPTTPIYTDYGLTHQAANPYSADANGNFTFYVPALTAPNLYLVQVSIAAGLTYSYVYNGPVVGGGGGGAGNPAGAYGSVQFNNNGVFGGLLNTNYSPTAKLLTIGDSQRILSSTENFPRTEYDVMNPAYAGGWDAAYHASSAHDETAVIQATLDSAECQYLSGTANLPGSLTLPSNYSTFYVSQIKLWGFQEIKGPGFDNLPVMGHNSRTLMMVTGHVAGDTLGCPNGTTYTPGLANGWSFHDMAVVPLGQAGSGTASDRDTAVFMNGYNVRVYNIAGYGGSSWGAATILNQGFETDVFNIGKVGSQLEGCASYIAGNVPLADIVGGFCAAYVDAAGDGQNDNLYLSDGVQITRGPLDPCTAAGRCAGFVDFDANSTTSRAFVQISGIDAIIDSNQARILNSRLDATLGPAMTVGGNGNIIDVVNATSPCTSSQYATNYAAGTATGCAVIKVFSGAQGNSFSNIFVNTAAGQFGNSYIQGWIEDDNTSGSAKPNTYLNVNYSPNPLNATANDQEFMGFFQNDHVSGQVFWPAQSPFTANGPTVDVSGIVSIQVVGSTPVLNLNGGIGAQPIWVTEAFGTTGATIAPGGNIHTCTNQPEPLSAYPVALINEGSLQLGDAWYEICITPQSAYVHLNYYGNYVPTSYSVVDFIGDAQAHQYQPGTFTYQLYGTPVTSGVYTFMQEADFADGSRITTGYVTGNNKLSTLSGGEIFITYYPQATSYKMWLVANSTGDGSPLGQILPTMGPQAAAGGYWPWQDFTSGGNGASSPSPSINTTGRYLAPYGVNLALSGALPACNADSVNVALVVPGNGTSTATTFQICSISTSGTYSWVTH